MEEHCPEEANIPARNRTEGQISQRCETHLLAFFIGELNAKTGRI